ncbi:GNAT family N-acyltransferase [Streptomyces sp. NPDC055607]
MSDELRIEVAAVGAPGQGAGERESQRALLEEISAFRARTYYAGGLRPGFRADGNFADAQPQDEHAYHVMLRRRSSDALSAVVRLIPRDWAAPAHSAVGQVFGAPATDLLRRLGHGDADVLEGGRLAVAPEQQNYSVGPLVSLVGLAFAELIGRSMLWGLSGTADRQDVLFARLGAHIHHEFRVPDPAYRDTMTLYRFDVRAVPTSLRPHYEHVQSLLATLPLLSGRRDPLHV